MATIFFSTNDYDRVECVPKEFDAIVKRSQEIVNGMAGSEKKHVLVLQTSGNKIHEAIIDWSSEATAGEQMLLHTIEKDETLIWIICCWSDGTFDMPSYHFRKKLCELNSDNEAAQMLLNGEKGIILKSIKETFSYKNSFTQ